MSKFNLLFETSFTSTDTVVVTHNLNRSNLHLRLIDLGTALGAESRSELIDDIILDTTTPLDKLTVKLLGTYTGVVQIIDVDTVPSPLLSVEDKLAAQIQTDLAGTAPAKFEYGGNANAGRVLEYTRTDDSSIAPFLIIAPGKLRALSFGAASAGTLRKIFLIFCAFSKKSCETTSSPNCMHKSATSSNN